MNHKTADAKSQIGTTSIDPDEIEKFRAMADEWWDPHGKFRPLHKFNPTRLAFIRDTLVSHFNKDGSGRKPLEGLKILDIGCGGGLVSEPVHRMGARVTGVDAGEKNIKTAMAHADDNGLDIDYRVGAAEALIEEETEQFDAVLNLEVVEHVANPSQFLQNTAKLVRPGGMMIAASINRTPKAFALAIVGAEYVLGWLPRGTHIFEKLVKPEEMQMAFAQEGMTVVQTVGVSYNPVRDRWSLSDDVGVNYMCVAAKVAA